MKREKGLMWSSNYSIGVNILFALNQRLADLLKPYPDYHPHITEVHHIHKLDAPSGTAKTLQEAIGNKRLKVEDIEDVVIGTFPRQGRYYILVDPYNNRYDSCHKKSFIRLQANDKNREFIELFWHRPIIKELPQDTILRNSKIKNFG